MQMQQINFPTSAQEILNQYFDALGVLEFILFQVDQNKSSLKDLHRVAAMNGLNLLIKRENTERCWGPDNSSFLPQIELKLRAGNEVFVQSFMGDSFDAKTQLFNESSEVSEGFAFAFLNPPYSLKVSGGAVGAEHELFLNFLNEVLRGPEAGAKMFSWNTESSSYFDAGREWWGCFFWTLEIPSLSRIIVIVGSSTD